MDTDVEIWKDIPDFEGYYQVSNFGRIKNIKTNHIKVPDLNTAGYFRVQLCKNKKHIRFLIHRLVARVFVDGYFDGAVVNHIDMNKQNNRWDNLEWVTQSENQKKAIEIRGVTSGMFTNKPYHILYGDGTIMVFKTLRECAKYIGYSLNGLRYRIKFCYGYIPQIDGIVEPHKTKAFKYIKQTLDEETEGMKESLAKSVARSY